VSLTVPRGAPPAATPAGFDPRAVRAQFPLLNAARPIVYLDSAATSQKPERVLAAMDRYYREINSNIHRGVYRIAEEATAAYEDARRRVAAFIGAAGPREAIFTRNSTEALGAAFDEGGRRDRADRDGAPLEPRAVADPRGRARHRAALHSGDAVR
jgi:cysteine desulfurase/selenocysteine lyase